MSAETGRITALLGHPHDICRGWVVDAIGELGGREDPLLLQRQQAEEDSDRVLIDIAFARARLGDVSGIPEVIAFLRHPEMDSGHAVTAATGFLRHPRYADTSLPVVPERESAANQAHERWLDRLPRVSTGVAHAAEPGRLI